MRPSSDPRCELTSSCAISTSPRKLALCRWVSGGRQVVGIARTSTYSLMLLPRRYMSLRRRATSSTSSSVSAVDRRGLPRLELPLKSIRQRDSWLVSFQTAASVEDARAVKKCEQTRQACTGRLAGRHTAESALLLSTGGPVHGGEDRGTCESAHSTCPHACTSGSRRWLRYFHLFPLATTFFPLLWRPSPHGSNALRPSRPREGAAVGRDWVGRGDRPPPTPARPQPRGCSFIGPPFFLTITAIHPAAAASSTSVTPCARKRTAQS